jgi:hypothetical protein
MSLRSRLESLKCLPEVNDMLDAGKSTTEVVKYIRETRKEMLDISYRGALVSIGTYSRNPNYRKEFVNKGNTTLRYKSKKMPATITFEPGKIEDNIPSLKEMGIALSNINDKVAALQSQLEQKTETDKALIEISNKVSDLVKRTMEHETYSMLQIDSLARQMMPIIKFNLLAKKFKTKIAKLNLPRIRIERVTK